MRTTITTNGQTTNEPGAYGNPKIDPGAPSALFKNMGLVGAFPWLEKLVVRTVPNKDGLLRDTGADAEGFRLANLIYNPANDSRVGNGPRTLYMVNVADSTQASLVLLDALGATSMTIYSTAWGTAGNRTNLALSKSGVNYGMTVSRDGVSRSKNASPASYFTLLYAGDFWNVTVATVAGTVKATVTATALTVAGTRKLAVGALTPLTEVCAGVLSFTPSVVADDDPVETYTVTVVGTTAAGAPVTEVLTWVTADGVATKSTVALSAFTSVTVATDGGSSPTFAMAGNLYVGTFSGLSSIAALTGELDARADLTAQTYATPLAGFSPSIGTLAPTEIDPIANVSVLTAATFTGVKSALATRFAATGLVTVVNGPGGIPVAVTGNLAGGTQTTPTALDHADGLAQLEDIEADNVVCLSTDIAVAVAVREHVEKMRGVGAERRSSRCGIMTDGVLASLSEAQAAAEFLNSPGVRVQVEDIKVLTASGDTEWLSPAYFAVLATAMVCGLAIARPLTWKYPNVVDVRNASDWSTRTDAQTLIDAGVSITKRKKGRIFFNRDCTTSQESSLVYTEPSCDESLDATIAFVRDYTISAVGEPTVDSSDESIRMLADEGFKRAVALGYCRAYDQATVSATLIGDRWVIGGDIEVVTPGNFIDIQPGVHLPGITTVSIAL